MRVTAPAPDLIRGLHLYLNQEIPDLVWDGKGI